MKQRAEIAAAEPAQLSEIAEIAALSFSDPWSEKLFQQTMAQENSRIWCMTIGKTVCAYLVLSRVGDEMSVDDIAVHPAYQRQGFGRQLLEWAHEQHPKCDFWLEVRESNGAAIALYQALHYMQVGYRKRYYQNPEEGAVLMTRCVEQI